MKRIFIVCMVAVLACGCGLRSDQGKSGKNNGQEQAETKTDLVAVAIQLIQGGKILEGVKVLDQVIMEDPANVQAYILLGQTYMHMNEFDRAVDSFRAALNVDPNQGEVYYMLALTNGLRGRKDLAINNAEKALFIFQRDQDGENFKRALVLLQGLSQE